MTNWPSRVTISTDGLDKLQSMLKSAYKQIVSEISTSTDFGVARRKAILSQIDEHLTSLGTDVNDFLAKELPDYYKSGANDAVNQLQRLGQNVPVASGFNQVHKKAIEGIYSDAASSFADALQGMSRSAQRLVSQAAKAQITQDIATGIAKGDTVKNVTKTIKATLQADGLDSLIDKSGRAWTLDNYSEMLYRTKVVEARNLGMVNRMAENGYDLVQVSAHGAIDVCGAWEGQILSSTGATPGYPTVDQATTDGLFHPNCRHAINAIVPDLFTETQQYNPDTGEYDPSIRSQLQSMLKTAAEYNDEFGRLVNEIADKNDWEAKIGNVKKEDRAMEKIVNDYAFNPDQLKDINRSVILIDDPSNIDSILKQIGTKFDVTRVKNDFESDAGGYKKILINVATPAGTGEIQLTTPEYWQAKKELGGDKLYNAVRVQEGDWEQALEKMNTLYDAAASSLESRLKSS